MRVIHLISGGDVGGAKTHVLSLLQGLNQAHQVPAGLLYGGALCPGGPGNGHSTQVLPGWNIPRIICRLEELIGRSTSRSSIATAPGPISWGIC